MALMAQSQSRPTTATATRPGGAVRNRPGNLAGERALLVAVMLRAVTDLQSERPAIRRDALDYFAGDVYQDHLAWLDLPDDWRPEALTR